MTTKKQPEPPVEESAELVVTPASEWPKEPREITVKLPSGAVATLKRPGLSSIMQNGGLPSSVRKIFAKHATPEGKIEGLSKEEARIVNDFAVAASFVSPTVSLMSKKGGLRIRDISDDDKAFVVMRLRLDE